MEQLSENNCSETRTKGDATTEQESEEELDIIWDSLASVGRQKTGTDKGALDGGVVVYVDRVGTGMVKVEVQVRR